LIYPLKYFCFDLPPNRPNKNQFYFFFLQEIFVFVWPIKGVNQNKNILQGLNQKKYFTGEKPEITYITGGKDLLTLILILKFCFVVCHVA